MQDIQRLHHINTSPWSRLSLLVAYVFFGLTPVISQDLGISKLPITRHFEPVEYQAGIQNWDFDLDSAGVLFVANNYGLLEFDGKNWRNYDVPSSTKLRAIYIDNNDRIFVGSPGQIGYFTRGVQRMEFVSLLERLNEDERGILEVWDIFEINDRIYFSSTHRLFELYGDNFKEIDLPHPFPGTFEVNDQLYVHFATEGLYLYQDGQFHNVLSPFTEGIRFIHTTGNGLIILTSGGNVYIHQDDNLKEKKINWDTEVEINTSVRLSNGNFVVGTQNDGLYILNENWGIVAHYTKSKGLNDRTVHAVMEDDYGNLWVGLNNGIDYLEINSPVSIINEQVGLEGTGYAAMVWKDVIYLGTNNGLFALSISEDDLGEYQLIEGTEGQVYNLSVVRDKLIVNQHKGSFQLSENNKLTPIRGEGTWRASRAWNDRMLLGSYTGMSIYDMSNGLWQESKRFEDFDESSRLFHFWDDSTVWMTHGYKGAYLLKFDRNLERLKSVEHFGGDDGFPSDVLISVYRLQDNLVFTAEHGIYQFEPETKRFIPNPFLEKWLGDTHVSNLTESKAGDIYFISSDEFGYLKKKSFGIYDKETTVLNRFKGAVNDDLANISILGESDILVGTKEGFIHFNPKMDFKASDEVNVYMNPVEIMFESDSVVNVFPNYLGEQKLEKVRSVKFDFASPYFAGFENTTYSYRLKGFEEHWSNWTTTNTKEYTSLPHGKYEFQVRAKNIFHTESEAYLVNFEIEPRWYESNLAYILYTLIGSTLLGLLVFIQDKRHRKKHSALNQSKNLVIQEKEQQLNEVSVQSKLEIESLKSEKLVSEINYKNNELASVTMHLLNKNQFMQDIRQRIDELMSSEENSKEELRKILRTIDRSLSKDDSWDQFAFHFDQVHGDFLKKLNQTHKLTPQETKLAAYLRMNMTSKEIADLMNISVRGVELARYRLRKKLGLAREENLIKHLMDV